MTTYNVSNASQLKGAINSAKGGDIIRCAGGNYGNISITKKFGSNVTITSADSSNKAKFTNITVRDSANITFDKFKFDGTWSQTGITIGRSTNMAVQNSEFIELRQGAGFSKITGLKVQNNTFTSMYHDAMDFAAITSGVISGNRYQEKGSQPGYSHKDFIQFWTNQANGEGPSKNISISGNQVYAKDGQTHGIFINNEYKSMGMHQNISIQNNYVKTSHVHGITVAHANGVNISNNTLIKDGALAPLINVTPNSTNVKIINNITPSVPTIGNSTWVIYGNTDNYSGGVVHWTGGLTGTKVTNTSSTSGAIASTETVSKTGNTLEVTSPHADEFRFSAKSLGTGTKTSTVKALDFDDADTLVFINYKAGTFKDGGGVWNSADGTYVKIFEVADLKELDQHSSSISISANKSTDVLTVTIDQGALVHKVALAGLAADYLAL